MLIERCSKLVLAQRLGSDQGPDGPMRAVVDAAVALRDGGLLTIGDKQLMLPAPPDEPTADAFRRAAELVEDLVSAIRRDADLPVDELLRLTSIAWDAAQRAVGQVSSYFGAKENEARQRAQDMERTVSAVADVLDGLAKGNVDARIAQPLPGEFDVLRLRLDALTESLRQLVALGEEHARSCSEGQLSHRGEHAGLLGGFAALADQLNHAMESVEHPIQQTVRRLKALAEGRPMDPFDEGAGGIYLQLQDSVRSLDEVGIKISDVAERVSRGDLTVHLQPRCDEDVLLMALGRMQHSLVGRVAELRSIAGQVKSGSSDMLDTSERLAQRAANTAEVASDVRNAAERMRGATSDLSTLATSTAESTSQGRVIGERGAEATRQVIDKMSEIHTAAADVASVLRTVDNIAFQTHLLALNAAVEAANAGKHGHGFAVVAEEVRHLASRSADAAKETQQILEGVLSRIRTGMALATESGEALDVLVKTSTTSADLANRIAEAVSTFQTDLSGIHTQTETLDRDVRHTSQSTEELAMTSRSFEGHAQRLEDSVAMYELPEVQTRRRSGGGYRDLVS